MDGANRDFCVYIHIKKTDDEGYLLGAFYMFSNHILMTRLLFLYVPAFVSQLCVGKIDGSLPSYIERYQSGCFVLVHHLLKRRSSHSIAAVSRNLPHLHSGDQSSTLH